MSGCVISAGVDQKSKMILPSFCGTTLIIHPVVRHRGSRQTQVDSLKADGLSTGSRIQDIRPSWSFFIPFASYNVTILPIVSKHLKYKYRMSRFIGFLAITLNPYCPAITSEISGRKTIDKKVLQAE